MAPPPIRIPHIQFGVVSRSQGQHAVKIAAYSAADRYDAGDGRVFDFRRKRGEHQGHAMLLPDGAPAWAADAAELWRRAEAAGRRYDAQTARIVEIEIPRAVPPEMRMKYAQAIVRPWVEAGMGAQIDVHCTPAADGGENPHAHVALTRRRFDGDGFGPMERGWDKMFTDQRGAAMKQQMCDRANAWLEAHDIDVRVDWRNRSRAPDAAPPERNVPRACWEAHKHDPDSEAAAPVRATLADRQARRQLRAAQRAAAASTAEIAALGAEYDRRAVGLRPKDRRRVPWSDEWLPPVGGAVVGVERDAKGATIHLDGGGRVLDRGNRLTLAGPVNDTGLDALAEQAARHGWQQVEVTGPPAVRDRLARALEARGIQAVNHQPPAAPAVLGRRWTASRPTAAPEPPQHAQAAPRLRPAPAPAPETALPSAAPAYRPPWAQSLLGRRKGEK